MKKYVALFLGGIFLFASPVFASTSSNTSLLNSLYTQLLSLSSYIQNLKPTTQTAALSGAGSGLVGYWSFDEGLGTTASDTSGSSVNGILTNGPTWTTGKIGNGAVSFDGVNDVVTMGDMNQVDGLNLITVSTWVKFGVNGGGSNEVHFVDKSKCDGSINGGPFELGAGFFVAHKAEFVIYPTGGSPSAYLTSGSGVINIDDTNWHHVVGRYDGSALSVWVDGVLEKSTNVGAVTMSSTANALEVGGRCTVTGAPYYFNGSEDDVRIYNTALSDSQITQLYQLGITTPLSDIIVPSVPTNLSATAISSSQINLTWTASTDNTAVTGYKIYRNGSQVTTSATNSYSDTGLSPSTSYSYTVSAYDAAANNSAQSSSVSATTQAQQTSSNPVGSYSTSFLLTANPISEGGVWNNGQTNGLVWRDVRTTPGFAFGTQPGTGAPPYDDSTAILKGTWSADQSAQATVRIVNSSSVGQREVELRLRSTMTANSSTGYEILCNVVPGASYGIQIVRWNGPLNSYTYINNTSALNCVNGDVLKATVTGNPPTISVYRNNLVTPILTGVDTNANPPASGNPGIGFWNEGGVASDFGFSSFSATDSGVTPPPSDTTAPSIPTNLSATAISSSQINLTWTASTDNTAVAGYKIYRNGTQIGTSVTNAYSDTGLSASTAYTYTVSAYDAVPNNSSQTSSVSATTQAVSGGGTTAASCSASDVQTAINAATTGSTITIPAGSCAWSTQVTATLPANVTIQGAGLQTTLGGGDRTVITDNYGLNSPLFNISVPSSGVFRMTGITFQSGTGAIKDGGTVTLSGPLTGQVSVRLDHLHLNASSVNNYKILQLNSGVFGVLDHSVIDLSGTNAIYISNGRKNAGDCCGNYEWTLPTNFGGPDFFYIEDNQINGTNNAYPATRVLDGFTGARAVVRFNTLTAASLQEEHATGHGFDDRGSRAMEAYGNYETANPSQVYPNYMMFNVGSGGFLGWGNVYGANSIKNVYLVNVTRKDNTTYPQSSTPTGWGYCGTAFNGTGSAWDQNTNASTGYVCLDQPGRGPGDLLTGVFPSKVNSTTGTVAWPHQALEPLYFWNNTGAPASGWGGAVFSDSTGGRVVQNRDIYLPATSVQTSQINPFNGTAGTGWGTLVNRPTTCTTGVGYFATDQGNWNQSTSNPYGVQQNGADGVLYKCTSTNIWSSYYTPYTYPHPLVSGVVAPPPPMDLTAPSVPTGLTALAVSTTQVDLSWTASTDNTAVSGYKIYRNGTQVSTSATNSYSDTGLTASTAYTYTVSAYDAVPNNSAQSSSVGATTQGVVTGTLTALTCNASDVQAKINQAVDGNAVVIPVGSCTWTTSVSIPNKNITLKGSGANSTIISAGVDYTLSSTGSKPFIISDIGFNDIGAPASPNTIVYVAGGAKGWRIHDLKFTTGGAFNRLILTRYDSYGVIDHNTVTGTTPSEFVTVDDTDWTSYQRPLVFEDANAVYVEDNTIAWTNSWEGRPALDGERGGRAVFRYNNVTNSVVINHGLDSGSDASMLQMDVYNNTFTITDSMGTWSRLGMVRGGTGNWFNNKYIVGNNVWLGSSNQGTISLAMFRNNTGFTNQSWPQCTGVQYGMCGVNKDWTGAPGAQNPTLCPAPQGLKLCSISKVSLCSVDSDCPLSGETCTNYIDGPASTGGYACFMQTGYGSVMKSTPLYAWNNTLSGSQNAGGNPSVLFASEDTSIIAEGRDYFNGVVNPNFTAYPYPHPLVSGTVVTPPLVDTTFPTVSITSPTAGVVSGTSVSLSASASDNIGIASVRFLIDGSNIDPLLTNAPYSGTWDTLGVSNGVHTLTTQATDTSGNTTTSAGVSITVSNADTTLPQVNTFTLPSTSASLTVSISSLTATDNVGVTHYKVTETSSTPLASASGWTTSAPTSYTFSTAGSKTLYAWAKDSAGNVSSSRSAVTTITLPNNAPILTSIGNKSIAENSLLTFTLSATDADSDPLTYSANTLPSNATLSNNIFSFTPSFTQSGTYTITFSVSDSRGGVDTETITITVLNTNRPPVVSGGADQTLTLPATASLTAVASDPDNTALTYTWSKVSGAGAVTFSSSNSLTTTATFSTQGVYVIQVTVSDGTLSSSDTVSIGVNQAVPLDTDSDGVVDSLDLCPNTLSSLSSVVNLKGCPLPKVTKFTVTPQLTSADLNSVSNLSLSNTFGSVTFSSPVSLIRSTSQVDIDTSVNIAKGVVSIDSPVLPELNVPATITLYNIVITNPAILKDNALCDQCKTVSYNGSTFVFSVPSFSTYRIIADVTAPTITPSTVEGATLSGTQSLSATVTDDVSLQSVSFYLDSNLLTTASTPPFTYILNTLGVSNGAHTLFIVATDSSGNQATSTVSITVLNTTTVTPTTTVSHGGGGGGGSRPPTGVLTPTVPQTPLIPSSSPSVSSPFTQTLSLGVTSPEVLLLQQYLNQQGYTISLTGIGSTGNESTYFGDKTRLALIRYQVANSLPPTGQVDATTLAHLKTKVTSSSLTKAQLIAQLIAQIAYLQGEIQKILNARKLTTPTYTPTYTPPVVTTSPSSSYTTQIADLETKLNVLRGSVSIPLFTRSLSVGSVGDDVVRLRNLLASEGFTTTDSTSDSSTFTTNLKTALAKFQEYHRDTILAPNNFIRGEGGFGPSTRQAINDMITIQALPQDKATLMKSYVGEQNALKLKALGK